MVGNSKRISELLHAASLGYRLFGDLVCVRCHVGMIRISKKLLQVAKQRLTKYLGEG